MKNKKETKEVNEVKKVTTNKKSKKKLMKEIVNFLQSNGYISLKNHECCDNNKCKNINNNFYSDIDNLKDDINQDILVKLTNELTEEMDKKYSESIKTMNQTVKQFQDLLNNLESELYNLQYTDVLVDSEVILSKYQDKIDESFDNLENETKFKDK